MRRLALIIALCGLGLAMLCEGAWSQDRDLQPLLDRLDRLERDVNQLQRQVYQGAYQNVAPSGTPRVPAAPTAQTALSNELAISQLEDEMRSLNGQIEEINYNLNQLKNRLDRLSNDVDMRFSQIEHGAPPPGGTPFAQAPAAAVPPPPPPGAAAAFAGSATAPDQPPASPSSAGSGVLPSGTPQEQYNQAFGLLRRADYPAAEQALRAFVQRYPNSPLAGNAQYWLGETYYVRKDYKNAATAFAEGYRKYPKSPKAADGLLKLGMTLGNLGQKTDACKAFSRLDHDFPSAPANVKEQEAGARHSFGC